MQTRTYGELIDLIQSLIGAGTMTGDEYLKISNFINRRFAEAYNASPSWYRYVVSSEARDINQYTLSDATASTSTSVNQNYKILGTVGSNASDVATVGTNIYEGVTTSTVRIYKNTSNAWVVATGTAVSQNADATYDITTAGTVQFTEADTIKKNVLEDVEVFTPRAGSDVLNVERKNLIPYAETGENTIAEFIRIHRKKAFLNRSAIEYDFFVDANGANILNVVNSEDGKAFVTYKIPLTLFTVAVSDPPVAADFVDGGTTNGAANRALTVPLEFFYYLAHSSFADFLRLESKYADARTEESIAQTYLAQELEKIDIRNNNNSLNKKFSTYVNRQSR